MDQTEEAQLKEDLPKSGETDAGELFNRMVRFMDVNFKIDIDLGTTFMSIRDIVSLNKGSIIHLNKSAGEAIEVYANGKLIAKGEVLVLEENFGVRITDLVSVD